VQAWGGGLKSGEKGRGMDANGGPTESKPASTTTARQVIVGADATKA